MDVLAATGTTTSGVETLGIDGNPTAVGVSQVPPCVPCLLRAERVATLRARPEVQAELFVAIGRAWTRLGNMAARRALGRASVIRQGIRRPGGPPPR